MSDRKITEQLTSKDQLVTRPDDPLPTPEEPRGPHARGYPADPRPDPETKEREPAVRSLDYTA